MYDDVDPLMRVRSQGNMGLLAEAIRRLTRGQRNRWKLSSGTANVKAFCVSQWPYMAAIAQRQIAYGFAGGGHQRG